MIHHLIASRHLIHNILYSSSIIESPDQLSLFGFLFEMYSYRSLGSSIHPHDTPFPHTPTNLEFLLGAFARAPQYHFYSLIFSSQGHLMSTFAPRIASLISLRMRTSACQPVSAATYTSYQNLAAQLCAWKLSSYINLPPQKATALILEQNTLLVDLHSMFLAPSITSFPSSRNASIATEIQTGIEICLPILSSIYPSQMEGIALWPSMIIGSCLTTDGQRNALRTAMGRARYKTNTLKWIGEVLERLWLQGSLGAKEGNYGIFWGPRGLAAVLETGDIQRDA